MSTVKVVNPATGEQLFADRKVERVAAPSYTTERSDTAWVKITPDYYSGLEYRLGTYPIDWVQEVAA